MLTWLFDQGLASAFAHAPRLGGVLFSLIVSSMAIFYFLGIYSDRAAQTRSPLDGKASTFVEQVISSVRIVQSFDMSDRLLHRLDHGMLKPLKTMAKTKAGFKALEQAVAFGFAMLVYSMCFWYGGISVEHGVSVGAVVTVSGCVPVHRSVRVTQILS
jgi:ATP-binding cassette subfamily B (MDR/TAP) protein 1